MTWVSISAGFVGFGINSTGNRHCRQYIVTTVRVSGVVGQKPQQILLCSLRNNSYKDRFLLNCFNVTHQSSTNYTQDSNLFADSWPGGLVCIYELRCLVYAVPTYVIACALTYE